MAQIKYIHNYKRDGNADILLAFMTRDAGATDALYQWNGTGWTEIWQLPGTNLRYDAVNWRDKVFFCDGKNGIWVYDALTNVMCKIQNAPVVQYLIVHQDRLVGAGDARTKAEVEAAGGVWPQDSNRDRVLFCEVLDYDTWPPNNFIDCRTGTGEVISGLGINSITTADTGAQSQLVIFKPSAILINHGTLGAIDQLLSVVSTVMGCPAYKSIVNTPYGLMFATKESVGLLDSQGREPQQVGFHIESKIRDVPSSLKSEMAAVLHENTYKLSVGASGASTNNQEWWLDLRPALFPNEQNWYGPHTDDKILQYEIFNGELIGAEHGTVRVWKLDREGFWGSMTNSQVPRTSIAKTGRIKAPGMYEPKLDAYGFTGKVDPDVVLTLTADVDRGASTEQDTWTTPASLPSEKGVYGIIRPIKRPGHDVQLTLQHSVGSDMELYSIYVRSRERRRQAEKQSGSTQA